MNTITYTEPCSSLLTLGEPYTKWKDYLKIHDWSQEHIPQLLMMVQDKEQDSWGPVHACRILSVLRATEAVPVLLGELRYCDTDVIDYWDWIFDDIPKALGMIGPPALQATAEYLSNEENPICARLITADALAKIAQEHQEMRSDCLKHLETLLSQYEQHDAMDNGIIVCYFLDLKATESFPLIEQVYTEGPIDLTVCGDLEDVEISLGLRQKRSTPQPRYSLEIFKEIKEIKENHRKRNRKKFNKIKKKDSPSQEVTPKVKVGRNDPCPCKSGKKYKKCCL